MSFPAPNLTPLRQRTADPVLNLGFQRLVDGRSLSGQEGCGHTSSRPPAPHSRARQSRSQSIGQLEFLPLPPSMPSSFSHPSIVPPSFSLSLPPPSLPPSSSSSSSAAPADTSTSAEASGTRFSALLFHSSYFHSLEGVSGLRPAGGAALGRVRRPRSSSFGYLSLFVGGDVTHQNIRLQHWLHGPTIV